MSADLAAQLAGLELQKAQRQQALRALLERPNLPPRHRTVVLLVPELQGRTACGWDVWAQLVGVSVPTAKAYLRELRTWGVLEEGTAGGRPCDLRLVTA